MEFAADLGVEVLFENRHYSRKALSLASTDLAMRMRDEVSADLLRHKGEYIIEDDYVLFAWRAKPGPRAVTVAFMPTATRHSEIAKMSRALGPRVGHEPETSETVSNETRRRPPRCGPGRSEAVRSAGQGSGA